MSHDQALHLNQEPVADRNHFSEDIISLLPLHDLALEPQVAVLGFFHWDLTYSIGHLFPIPTPLIIESAR